ncbi:hypothetical protein [Streptomyces sp. NPDC002994]
MSIAGLVQELGTVEYEQQQAAQEQGEQSALRRGSGGAWGNAGR